MLLRELLTLQSLQRQHVILAMYGIHNRLSPIDEKLQEHTVAGTAGPAISLHTCES